MIKIVIILVILIGLGLLGAKISQDGGSNDILVALDRATQQAINRGEFEVPEGVSYVEQKDCEGTEWIKQKGCSLNGKPMDGTEGSCGSGKEIWILDQTHSSFKPATGGGKCEPEERDCNVECPKPCEGDTWKNSGKCIRREYDIRGNMKEVVLDGTEGKCGEGITQFNLDTTAPDYKPAVGKGSCPVTKGGACNVPCPKPEPPKCNSYGGWIENTGLGCVINENSSIKVNCGQTGVKQKYKIATNPTVCEELIDWSTCTGKPCPIDCVGSWSGWSAPKSDESCGVQPYKEKTYSVTTQAQHGGQVCGYTHGDTRKQNAGSPLTCCEVTGDWAKVGDCKPDGTAKWTRPTKENKPGGCDDSQKAKFMACCYQKGNWTDTSPCNPATGEKTQKQDTKNCPESYKTRRVNCAYVGEWEKVGVCENSKQKYKRTVHHSNEARTKEEVCCSPGEWTDFICNPNSNSHSSNRGDLVQSRSIVGCPADTPFKKTIPNGCNYRGCKIALRAHWCRDGGPEWEFTKSERNLHRHGAGDTVSSYKMAGENCSASVYSGTSYSGMQWNNRHTVKNKNWSNRQCWDMHGPDNSISSMSLTSYATRLGPWQGPNTSDD